MDLFGKSVVDIVVKWKNFFLAISIVVVIYVFAAFDHEYFFALFNLRFYYYFGVGVDDGIVSLHCQFGYDLVFLLIAECYIFDGHEIVHGVMDHESDKYLRLGLLIVIVNLVLVVHLIVWS